MAFIHDDVSIASHKVSHAAKANQALHHRYVDLASTSVFPRTDLADFFWLFAKEQRKLCDPLIEKRLAMNKNEGIPMPDGDQKSPYDGLARSRRCHQDAYVVSHESLCSSLLTRGESTREGTIERGTFFALIHNRKRDAIFAQQGLNLGPAPTRQGDVLGEIFSTCNDPGGECSRKPHALPLVELWILESRQAFDPIKKRRGKAVSFEKKALRNDSVHFARKGLVQRHLFRVSRRGPFPWHTVGFLLGIDRSQTHHLAATAGVLNDFSNTTQIEALDTRQKNPLVVVGSE